MMPAAVCRVVLTERDGEEVEVELGHSFADGLAGVIIIPAAERRPLASPGPVAPRKLLFCKRHTVSA